MFSDIYNSTPPLVVARSPNNVQSRLVTHVNNGLTGWRLPVTPRIHSYIWVFWGGRKKSPPGSKRAQEYCKNTPHETCHPWPGRTSGVKHAKPYTKTSPQPPIHHLATPRCHMQK